jgi:hypothetical protein
MRSHTSSTRSRSSFVALLAIVVALAAGGAWLQGAGTARAPEPADINGTLGVSNGATANAVFVSSREPTTVLRWPNSWMYGPQYPAGQPCMTSGEVGQLAGKVLVAYGGNRKCA